MLRFQQAISSGLAAILVPAVFLGQGSIETLEATLAQTVRALEVLGGIRESAAAGDPQAVGFARAVTEDPILDERRRDERLVDLRNQVNLLHAELDVLQTPLLLPDPVPPMISALGQGQPSPLPEITKGLSDEELRALLGTASTQTADTPQEPDKDERLPNPAISTSGGYSADPVGHARACYYAQRYEQAVMLVAELDTDPDALFWKGRALEKLGRLDEAIAAMSSAAELVGERAEGRRVRAELEFLEWRRSFLRDAPHHNGGGAQ